MTVPMSPGRRLAQVLLLAAFGAVIGFLVAAIRYNSDPPLPPPGNYPLPHHIAKYPGGVSFRFAMVHDVVHERYPKHGPAYYRERNRVVRRQLDELRAGRQPGKPPPPEYFRLLDDLAVGLTRLGEYETAVQILRDKLQEQTDLGQGGRERYTSYANLGTILILWQIADGFADVPRAKERIQESIDLIRRAVAVNPESHFGREQWQLILEEFLLVSLDRPDIVLEFDMIGNRLDQNVGDLAVLRSYRYGTFFDLPEAPGGEKRVADYLANRIDDPDGTMRARLRRLNTPVGAEPAGKQPKGPATDWQTLPISLKEPVPFDEPMLGIIGMWRYGGGPNPHFALCLGETMLRVGQRYLAWTAFERAAQLASFVGPEPIARRYLEHCRGRQVHIESSLPPEEVARLRPRFEKELAFGRQYQADYQAYEQKRIEEGASIDDPHFYDAFLAGRPPIASPIGAEERFLGTYAAGKVHSPPLDLAVAASLLGAGLCAFPWALYLRWRWPGRASDGAVR